MDAHTGCAPTKAGSPESHPEGQAGLVILALPLTQSGASVENGSINGGAVIGMFLNGVWTLRQTMAGDESFDDILAHHARRFFFNPAAD